MTTGPSTDTDPSSDQGSQAFSLLDPRVQRWIWERRWTELRDAQERAIPAILAAERDVIIAAATAAGKTEAAFLPILTRLASTDGRGAGGIALYVGPLKALINDQWSRLLELCEALDIPVTPWHGDISASKKQRFLRKPRGCLLITPESLEGILIRDGHALAGAFGRLEYIVIDELHAFIDTERGQQLQSLLCRIETALGRRIVRVALSATLGDMRLASEFLRPHQGSNVVLIEDRSSIREVRVIVKGYVGEPPKVSPRELKSRPDVEIEDLTDQGTLAIARDLYENLRGSHNLVFPNSRRQVEVYADLLRRRCEKESVPNTFWPHHGNLSRDIREYAEQALRDKTRPATAIATTTLELGIDIGAVRAVAQIGPAPSVASLMQRLGRSGRQKGEAAILRAYCLETKLEPDSHLSDQLHEGLIEIAAQIRLLGQRWFEPPRLKALHLSTLFQQLLALLGQYGGLTASRAWELLFERGAFQGLSQAEFAEFLRGLAAGDVIVQDATGLLLPGVTGERILNHYSFLTAFASEEEFRVQSAGQSLGSLPVSRPILPGSYIIFAGRRWRVIECQTATKVIDVEPAGAGKPPAFDGMGGRVHDRVRAEMRQILLENQPLAFLDQTANVLLLEARESFHRHELDRRSLIASGNETYIVTWSGDITNDTLALLLSQENLEASNQGLSITVRGATCSDTERALCQIAEAPTYDAEDLAAEVENVVEDKWDELIPDRLLRKGYAARALSVADAQATAQRICQEQRTYHEAYTHAMD